MVVPAIGAAMFAHGALRICMLLCLALTFAAVVAGCDSRETHEVFRGRVIRLISTRPSSPGMTDLGYFLELHDETLRLEIRDGVELEGSDGSEPMALEVGHIYEVAGSVRVNERSGSKTLKVASVRYIQPPTKSADDELREAVTGNDYDKAVEAIRRGADVKQTDAAGNSLLHTAACYSGTKIIDLLVSHQADVDAIGFKGETPLDWAARCCDHGGGTDRVKALVRHGGTARSAPRYRNSDCRPGEQPPEHVFTQVRCLEGCKGMVGIAESNCTEYCRREYPSR